MCWEVLIISPPLFLQIGATPVAVLLNLKLNVMVKVIIFWIGDSKSGNHYLGVNRISGDFASAKGYFVRVINPDKFKVGDTVEVPEEFLTESA